SRLQTEFAAERPFQGRRIAASLHITTETAVLLQVLRAGGAGLALCASNPLSTRDDICAALVADGIAVYAHYGEDLPTYQRHIEQTLAIKPHLVMDGFQVLPMVEAAPLGDIFVTATGMAGVIRSDHFLTMKDGAMLANSGHFDVEVDVAALRHLSVSEIEVREHLAEFQLPNGKVLHLLAQGRLVGQVAAEASPAAHYNQTAKPLQ